MTLSQNLGVIHVKINIHLHFRYLQLANKLTFFSTDYQGPYDLPDSLISCAETVGDCVSKLASFVRVRDKILSW